MEYPQKLLDLVEKINDGEWEDLKPLFGDFDAVVNILSKFDMLHLIDPYESNVEGMRNELIYHLLNNEKVSKEWYEKLIGQLGDIELINGEYYLDLDDLSDLHEWFQHYSRDYSPEDVAKRVLGEDGDPFYYHDTTDDVYGDVIEVLTPKNMAKVKEKVFEILNNKEIEIDGLSSDLMEELAKEQGKEESFIVNSQNIDRIINDEDTMRWLLKNDLADFESDLNSLHNNAYNSAYENYLHRIVWNSLDEHLDTSANPNWYQHGKKHRVRLKVNLNSLIDVVKEFYSQYREYTDDIDDIGSYFGLVRKFMFEGPYDFLTFRIPDYPDYRDVENNINEYFDDYI